MPGPSIRILVPTDFEEEAALALDRALAIAHVHPVTAIEVVHVQTPGHPPPPTGRLADVRATLEAKLACVPRAMSSAVVSREAPTVVDGILEAAKDMSATLILIGTRGGGLLAEGVAEQVVCRGSVDVLVVGRHSDRRWPERPVRIVVPIDFSVNAHRALLAAHAWAGTNTVAALHVVDPSDPNAAHAMAEPGRLRARIAEWSGGAATEVAVDQGSPERVIAREAACDSVGLLVVGATGASAPTGRSSHGIPLRLLGAARAPVLIVR